LKRYAQNDCTKAYVGFDNAFRVQPLLAAGSDEAAGTHLQNMVGPYDLGAADLARPDKGIGSHHGIPEMSGKCPRLEGSRGWIASIFEVGQEFHPTQRDYRLP
jgi:hypothetical protein